MRNKKVRQVEQQSFMLIKRCTYRVGTKIPPLNKSKTDQILELFRDNV